MAKGVTVERIGALGYGGSGSAVSVTLDGGAATGEDVLISGGFHTSATLSGVTDSKGNTYVIDVASQRGGVYWRFIARSRLTTPLVAGDTITLQWSAGATAPRMMNVLRVTGLADGGPVSLTNTSAGTTVLDDQTVPMTNVRDGLLLVSYLYAGNPDTTTFTPDDPRTQDFYIEIPSSRATRSLYYISGQNDPPFSYAAGGTWTGGANKSVGGAYYAADLDRDYASGPQIEATATDTDHLLVRETFVGPDGEALDAAPPTLGPAWIKRAGFSSFRRSLAGYGFNPGGGANATYSNGLVPEGTGVVRVKVTMRELTSSVDILKVSVGGFELRFQGSGTLLMYGGTSNRGVGTSPSGGTPPAWLNAGETAEFALVVAASLVSLYKNDALFATWTPFTNSTDFSFGVGGNGGVNDPATTSLVLENYRGYEITNRSSYAGMARELVPG